MENTVRASTLAAIMGHNTAAPIQNPEKSGDAPYCDDDFGKGLQKHFTGAHALKIMLVEGLRAQGCSVALAGERVRAHASPVKMFLDEIEADKPITQRFVLAMQTAAEDSLTGVTRWWPSIVPETGTQDEVIETFASAVRQIGTISLARKGLTEERKVCGPWAAIQSIPEAYRLLRQRARAKGYVIDGRSINKVTDESEQAE